MNVDVSVQNKITIKYIYDSGSLVAYANMHFVFTFTISREYKLQKHTHFHMYVCRNLQNRSALLYMWAYYKGIGMELREKFNWELPQQGSPQESRYTFKLRSLALFPV